MYIVDLCQKSLELDFFRGDYKELIHLTLFYLDAAPKESNLLRPGALYKARWMGKLLYSLKIVLLSNQINELSAGRILGKEQLLKLFEFVKFVVYTYIPWWLCAPVPAAAPANDLKLINDLEWYKENENVDMAESALKAMNRHTWYLTEELIPLALFDTSLN